MQLAAKPEYEKIRLEYNFAVDAETEILKKISYLDSPVLHGTIQALDFSKHEYFLSTLRGAAEVLLMIGPWQDLYAKVKLVKAARDQARLLSERFDFQMNKGAGFRTELAGRKHILDNYKALCTRWEETVGSWSTVAEEAAKFEAARKVNLTMTCGKYKGKHIDDVFEKDPSYVRQKKPFL